MCSVGMCGRFVHSTGMCFRTGRRIPHRPRLAKNRSRGFINNARSALAESKSCDPGGDRAGYQRPANISYWFPYNAKVKMEANDRVNVKDRRMSQRVVLAMSGGVDSSVAA